MTSEITRFSKTRELRYVVMVSTRWKRFEPRDGDIYIATFGKSGSTWMQQIVAQLLFNGEPGIEPLRRCVWPEFRLNPLQPALQRLAAQTHRRMLKTHMPVDAIGILPNAKYINVMRDTRDVASDSRALQLRLYAVDHGRGRDDGAHVEGWRQDLHKQGNEWALEGRVEFRGNRKSRPARRAAPHTRMRPLASDRRND
jgi:Sulfotransferase domain